MINMKHLLNLLNKTENFHDNSGCGWGNCSGTCRGACDGTGWCVLNIR